MDDNRRKTRLRRPARTAGVVVPALIAAAAVLILTAGQAAAQIGVSPPRTEFSLDGPSKTHTIRVFNLGERTVEIAVKVYHWDLDENNTVRIIPSTEQSLDQWMIINPLSFTLEPGGSQAVRFAARPKVRPEPGEHRAMVFFEQQPDAEMRAAPEQQRVLFNLGTSVIGLAEPVIRDAVVHSFAADPDAIDIEIESRGNTHVRLKGQWALWPADRFPGHDRTGLINGLGDRDDVELPPGMAAAWPLNPLPVLPGTRRIITTRLRTDGLAPGPYVLDIHGTVAGVDIGRTFTIELSPPTTADDGGVANGSAVVDGPPPAGDEASADIVPHPTPTQPPDEPDQG